MTITVPTSVGELTIDQFQRLAKTEDPIEQVAIACNISRDLVRSFDMASLERVATVMAGIQATDPQTFALVQTMELGGKSYGFHPNLSRISVGEYADLQTRCKDLTENLQHVMAVLYRPITGRAGRYYQIEEYTGQEDATPFLQMPMAAAYGAIGFFLTLSESFVRTSLHYLREEKRARSSSKNGDGTPPSTTSPKETR